MGDVLNFPSDDVSPEVVLDLAKDMRLTTVVIIGEDDKGDLWLSTNIKHAPDVLWWIEQAKMFLMSDE